MKQNFSANYKISVSLIQNSFFWLKGYIVCFRNLFRVKTSVMETTSFGAAATLLFVGVPTLFLIGLFVSTSDGEKSSFYSDSSKGRLSPEPKK